MPEFIMPMGDDPAARATFKTLDSFTQGYIEAMFFTDTGTGDDEEEGLQDATFADLAPETLAKIIKECEAFQAANREDLDEALDTGRIDGYDEEAAGRDYWYTRNGHGVGYWCRDLGDIGDTLAAAARYSERDLYRGDDGRLYLA